MSKILKVNHTGYDCNLSEWVFESKVTKKCTAIYFLYFKLGKILIPLYRKKLKGKWNSKTNFFELDKSVLCIDKKYLYSTVQFSYEVE